MVLKNNEIEKFYYNSKFNVVTGEDDLEMQRASFQMYSQLLPGVRNLARKYRYYSLYCWLSYSFGQNSEKKEPTHQDYKNFIRRGELLFGFISIFKFQHLDQNESELGSIFGANYINSYLKNNDPSITGEINFSNGADWESGKQDMYWQHSGGACYQYHLGPLKDMGLFAETEDGTPCFTKTKGKLLAEAFEESLTIEVAKIVLNAIKDGKISYEEIKKIADRYYIYGLKQESKEWQLLWSYLASPDDLFEEENLYRRTTLKYFLNYVTQNSWKNNSEGIDHFLHSLYLELDFTKKPEGWDQKTRYGWAYFHLNQTLTYAMENVLAFIVSELGEKKNELYSFIDTISRKLLLKLGLEGGASYEFSSNKLRDKYGKEKVLPFDLYLKCKNSDDIFDSASIALEYIFIQSLIHENHVSFIKEYLATVYNVSLDLSPEGCSLLSYLASSKQDSVLQVIQRLLLQKTVMVHIKNTFRKVGNTSSVTFKLLVEEGFIFRIANQTYPTVLSPRIFALDSLLRDLQVIHDDKVVPARIELVRNL